MLDWLKLCWNIVTKPGKRKRVFVGVSGGVDSSVSALLLKLYGYDVTGVFIRTWQPDWTVCTWRDERKDAMRVCAYLEIPFVELDLEKEYKQGVADYMIAEYQKGRTPNPDVMCNKEVKFGGFLKYAVEQNADYIATGHYAQTDQKNLFKGVDNGKDQSYFLWTLNSYQIGKSMFPVGGFQKSFVRKIAKLYGIPVAMKKDSQGVCFLGEIDMKEFLSHYIQSEHGVVKNETGEIIGAHAGVLLYTIGERHGFTINKKSPNDQPYYVVRKDIPKNEIIVSENQYQEKTESEFVLIDTVWRIEPEHNKVYSAQIRYHGNFYHCQVKKESGEYIISLESNELVSAGQSIVVYDKEVCMGGGIVR